MSTPNAVSGEAPLSLQPPPFDHTATLQFVMNDKAGSSDTDTTISAIETELRAAGRSYRVRFADPGELERTARESAEQARAERTAVVAVGGDGTINTVAQAAHAAGCTMGVLPEGTFNYFAREHGVPEEIGEALRWLLQARPMPVQVAAINERLFLVNASLGLYPELLQDRERWKGRFGRSRFIAFGAGMSTLLRAQTPLRLRVAWEAKRREVRALTLFVGNNQLQLAQLGLSDSAAVEAKPSTDGHVMAVILKPIGTLTMLGLMVRGAMGQLGGAEGLEHFPCEDLVVGPASRFSARKVKVAFDGEVTWMRVPLVIRAVPTPLWLLKTPSTHRT